MGSDSSGLGADLRSFETSLLFAFLSIPIYWALILHVCTKWILKEEIEGFKVSGRKFEAAPRLFICFIGFLVTFLSSFFMFELQFSTLFTIVTTLLIGSSAVIGFTLLFGMFVFWCFHYLFIYLLLFFA
jgi:uncharacterized membrane protein